MPNKEYLMTVEEASKLTNLSVPILKKMLVEQYLPKSVGFALPYENHEEKSFRYIIFKKRFIAFIEAWDMCGASEGQGDFDSIF